MVLRRLLVLGGFMGVGKSTLGRAIAEDLGLPWADLDTRVQERTGRSIPELFATGGEAAFRLAEAEALAEVLRELPVGVLSLGGGTLHQQSCLALLRAHGARVLVLHLDEAHRQRRLGELRGGEEAGQRPLLTEAETLFQERAPGYLEAGERVDLSGLDDDRALALVRHLVLDGEGA